CAGTGIQRIQFIYW
nr:immunoglobulin heavy chain junction region [Macaca mulatta]MOX93488.1 immunoglobulin heavy chain junction region [Macaca mulatta]MOX94119.1 immunoglobulin heavy chain junction region [Macaca mulatta]MOX95912.1 immunoglobulin heavy chain junction region [Macaca mulatta]MOX96061.1 immunoglobulin heavy chain junction region [Macaca mulatta]